MDKLKQELLKAGIDVSSLRPLSEDSDVPSYRLTVSGGDTVIEAWRLIRGLVDRTGYWPVLLGSPEELDYRDDSEAVTRALMTETLNFATTLSGAGWLKARQAERLEEFK